VLGAAFRACKLHVIVVSFESKHISVIACGVVGHITRMSEKETLEVWKNDTAAMCTCRHSKSSHGLEACTVCVVDLELGREMTTVPNQSALN